MTWQREVRDCGGEEVEQTRARNDLLHGKCAFTVEGYVQMAKELMDLDCIKDMATLLKLQPTYDIVKAIKELLAEQARIHVHVRATTGVTLVSLMKSIGAAPRPGSRGTTVFFVHPKTTEAAALGYPVELVQEA
jgi:hypothetical protein